MQALLESWFLSLKRESFSFKDLIGEDKWTEWTPTASLTVVGTPTYLGRFFIVGRTCEFQIKASSTTSIASTAGTHYFNLPFTAVGYSGVVSAYDGTALTPLGTNGVDITNSRAMLPTIVATGNTILVWGKYEV